MLLPPEGTVVEIFVRQSQFGLRVGFCRRVVLIEGYPHLIEPFRRAFDATMTTSWAEPISPETSLVRRCGFACFPEQEWMSVAAPEPTR